MISLSDHLLYLFICNMRHYFLIISEKRQATTVSPIGKTFLSYKIMELVMLIYLRGILSYKASHLNPIFLDKLAI